MRLSQRINNYGDASGGNVPIGSIIAYHPGYFGAVSNGGGFTIVGPGANTVAGVNAFLPASWRVCNGSALNDPESSIFNGATRFLPELTGQRFLSGNTSCGVAAGSNTTTIASANLPVHTHGLNGSGASAVVTGLGALTSHNHTVNYTQQTLSGNTSPASQTHSHGLTSGGAAIDFGGDPGNYLITGIRHGSLAFASGSRFNTLPGSVGGSPGGSNATRLIGTTDADNASSAISISAGGVSLNAVNLDHAHTLTGSTTDGGFANTAMNTLPQYLQVFYIMRVK